MNKGILTRFEDEITGGASVETSIDDDSTSVFVDVSSTIIFSGTEKVFLMVGGGFFLKLKSFAQISINLIYNETTMSMNNRYSNLRFCNKHRI